MRDSVARFGLIILVVALAWIAVDLQMQITDLKRNTAQWDSRRMAETGTGSGRSPTSPVLRKQDAPKPCPNTVGKDS